jgi:hypothetical protein
MFLKVSSHSLHALTFPSVVRDDFKGATSCHVLFNPDLERSVSKVRKDGWLCAPLSRNMLDFAMFVLKIYDGETIEGVKKFASGGISDMYLVTINYPPQIATNISAELLKIWKPTAKSGPTVLHLSRNTNLSLNNH